MGKAIMRITGGESVRTLDIGCGTGRLLDTKIVPAALYTGVDPSQSMLNRLVLKHPKVGAVIPTTINEAIPQLKGETFDLVTCLFTDLIDLKPVFRLSWRTLVMIGLGPIPQLKAVPLHGDWMMTKVTR